ncbi:MAG: alpha/beta hydrolase [Cyclobacteriaceae bacterium]|nr:alpha/beta hydrolase [Cyclobacteriaceae bacterium]
MDVKDYVVNIGPQGTFKPSGSYQSTPVDIDEMFQKFDAENIRRITLYFHGGLVNEKVGTETAIKMEKHLSSINQRPICFVWETGLMETVSSNLGKISETKLFEKLIKILTKKLASKLGFDIAEGRGAGVSLSDVQVDIELSKRIPFENYTQNILESKGRGADATLSLPSKPEDLEGEFKFEIEADFELISILAESKITISNTSVGQSRGIIDTALLIKSVAKIAFRVIKRFVIKRDHDFYPTIIEELLRELYIAELGAWVWNNMKTKSNDMWSDNSGLSGVNQFAGRYLFDKLVSYHKKYPEIQVNLVGHSAGSIAICNLLKMSAETYPQLVFENIIFMAPACRIDLFRNEMVSHQNRFKSFRMFTMTDENEKHDILVPYLYTHSLLYLISGVLEDEGKDYDSYILGLERHIKASPPYDHVREIIETNKFIYEAGKNRVAFSQTGSNAQIGLRTQSLSHGRFDDDDESGGTIESIKHMLK